MKTRNGRPALRRREFPCRGNARWTRGAIITSFVAVLPTTSAALVGLDCRFSEICVGIVCEVLDAAPLRMVFFTLSQDQDPVAMTLMDSRLFRGPRLEDDQDYSAIFGDYDSGTQPSVSAIGKWINLTDKDAKDVVVTFSDTIRLIIDNDVKHAGRGTAQLIKEASGLTALFGSTSVTGTCSPWGRKE